MAMTRVIVAPGRTSPPACLDCEMTVPALQRPLGDGNRLASVRKLSQLKLFVLCSVSRIQVSVELRKALGAPRTGVAAWVAHGGR